MENEHILNKLMTALNSLSDKELHQLASLFEQQEASQALIKLIESTLALREAERKSKSEIPKKPTEGKEFKGESREIDNVSIQNRQGGVHSMDDIRDTFALREAERKSKSEIPKKPTEGKEFKGESREIDNVSIQNRQGGVHSMDDIRDTFVALLNDRNIFPSIKSVVKALDASFNWGIAYKNFLKRGRRDLIKKCLRKLDSSTEREQRKMLKSFLSRIEKQVGEMGQYRELLRILAGNE